MTEPELIERARAGDRAAFARLYAPVERPLAAFLYRMTAMRLDAEDLAQQTVVRALETIGEFSGASSFRTWIFRLAAQAAMDYLRSRKQWDPDAQIRGRPKGRRRCQDAPPAPEAPQVPHPYVRSVDPLQAEGAKLHDPLMTFTRQVSHYG